MAGSYAGAMLTSGPETDSVWVGAAAAAAVAGTLAAPRHRGGDEARTRSAAGTEGRRMPRP